MTRNLFLLILFLTGMASDSYCQLQETRPNVLFVFVDDLRPELGCYGVETVKSPNLDALASQGIVFKKQFVTVPTCGASRYSILTGMLPRTKAHLSNHAIKKFISGEPEIAKPETFIHHLKRNGYYTVGIGKISHYPDGLIYGYRDNPKGAKKELPYSWNEMLFDPGKWGTAWNGFFGYADGSNRNDRHKEVKPYESADVNDRGYPDGLTANLAVEKLRQLAGKKQPFFLGIGFFKPHLPFNAPQKYWDLYDESEIPLTPSGNIPENTNPVSLHGSNEFNQYKSGKEKPSLSDPVSDDYARKLRHAYYASVSYVDAQIGKVLAELKRSGLADNTIVIVWGDHGWHLGDHRVWGKHTIFDRALRSPLIIKMPDGKSASSDKIVSSIDIYPTLMELCGLKMPHKTDGRSFADLVRNPHNNEDWKNVAYSYFRSGISVRTHRYRLTKYFREEEPVIELYDHKADPYENINIAEDHSAIVKKLMPLLEKGDFNIF